MRLKDGLILREVAGQYVIVPTGKRVNEVTNIVYISSSAAFLWNKMLGEEFTVDSLVDNIMEQYVGVTREVAEKDVTGFIDVLKRNRILEPEDGKEEMSGSIMIKIDRDPSENKDDM